MHTRIKGGAILLQDAFFTPTIAVCAYVISRVICLMHSSLFSCFKCHTCTERMDFLWKKATEESDFSSDAKAAPDELHKLLIHERDNRTTWGDTSAPVNKYPLDQLEQYKNSVVVQPYIEATLCYCNGLYAIMEGGDWDKGIPMVAKGEHQHLRSWANGVTRQHEMCNMQGQ